MAAQRVAATFVAARDFAGKFRFPTTRPAEQKVALCLTTVPSPQSPSTVSRRSSILEKLHKI